MEKDLIKFMEKVEIQGKDFSIYQDSEKGFIVPLNTVYLVARCECLELTKEEYQVALFQQAIEDLEYNITNIKKPVPKNEITKKEEDKYTLVEKEVAVRQVYKVSNNAGAFKTFVDKEEALEYATKINQEVFKALK